MKSSICLSDADQHRLDAILDHLVPSPWPNAEQAAVLRGLLSRARKSRAAKDPRDHVGFFDEVSLVSPVDPSDRFDFRIVMPAESDPDEGRVSVLLPISLAVLGCSAGETVSWECPRGPREMQIEKFVKSTELAV